MADSVNPSGYTDSPYPPDSSDEPIRHCLRPEELEAIERAWSKPVNDPYSRVYALNGGKTATWRTKPNDKSRAWGKFEK